jgi:hypothetical protein
VETVLGILAGGAFIALFAGILIFMFKDDPRLEILRRLLTRGLKVDATQREVRRGDEIEANVTASKRGRLGALEVGLVCTEYYDEEVSGTMDDPGSTRRTQEGVAYETWKPVADAEGAQTFHFTVPRNAPFSYKGDCLSYKWAVVARGRKRHRLDAQARSEIVVRP